jgi:hypothetical protein
MKHTSKALSFVLVALMGLAASGCSDPAVSDPAASGTPTVSLAAQSGTMRSRTVGLATFTASTANISAGTPGTISWYTDPEGMASGSVPEGIVPKATNVTGDSATVCMLATTSAVKGSYYFKATFGVSTSSVATLLIDYSMGDTGPAGGFVFYDKGSFSDGWRYLEAAPGDQSSGIQWDNEGYTLTGATATAIGTGAANTATIVASKGASSYAARLCADLTLGGYSDWFLPSKDELYQMYVILKESGYGDFSQAKYWSSSENGAGITGDPIAWLRSFDDGQEYCTYTYRLCFVRAARAF